MGDARTLERGGVLSRVRERAEVGSRILRELSPCRGCELDVVLSEDECPEFLLRDDERHRYSGPLEASEADDGLAFGGHAVRERVPIVRDVSERQPGGGRRELDVSSAGISYYGLSRLCRRAFA